MRNRFGVTIARGLAMIAALLLAGGAAPRTAAQSLYFSVPALKLQAFVQADGAVKLVYDITFENSASGAPIDAVDVGAPNASFELSQVTANLDGVPAASITSSPYVDPGFAVYVADPIPAGGSGTLHVEFLVRNLLYSDVTQPDYVSFQITPFWFGSEFVAGTTNLQIAVHALPGITPDELLSQDVAFTDKALFQERAVAIWEDANWSATGAYLVGVSFPKRGITAGVIQQTVLDLVVKWLEDNPETHFFLGLAVIAVFGLAFFRFSGGTGLSIFAVAACLLAGFMVIITGSVLAFIPLSLAAVIGVEVSRAGRRKTYLPAIAQVEGGGIKRGLTAPEAALLLELPLSRALGLVIFGLLKKGVLEQVKETPLTVKLAARYQDKGGQLSAEQRVVARQAAAQKAGVVLHGYEHAFLEAIQAKPDQALEAIDFSKPMKALVTGVAERLKGFDLSDTQDYYRRIVNRAVTEAERVGDVAQRQQVIDRDLEWIMMGPNQPRVFRTGGWNYQPMWVRPLGFPGGAGGGLAAPAVPGAGGKTSFGNVAAGFAGWAENTMGGLAAAIAPGSLQAPAPKGGGFIDLSGADKVTGDIFEALGKASSSSGGGRGGGGGGRSCACACAGCACACACAGGGR